MRALAVDQYLSGSAMQVVVRRHGHAVGSGFENGEQFPLDQGREKPVARQKIAGLAQRPNHLDGSEIRSFGRDRKSPLRGPGRCDATGSYGPESMKGAIERGAQERVHPAIDDDESLARAALESCDAGHQKPRLSHQVATRLEEDSAIACNRTSESFDDRPGKRLEREALARPIGHWPAAAQVDGPHADARGFDRAGQFEQHRNGF